MKQHVFPAVLAVSAVLAAPARADLPKVDPSLQGWKPEAELGLVATTGNSDTASARGRFGLKGVTAAWLHDHYLSVLRAEESGQATADRFEAGAKVGRLFGERRYLAGVGRYENDDFGAYAHQSTLALNYGAWLIRDEDKSLQAEFGPGLRQARDAETREFQRDGLLRGYADYRHQLTGTTRFFNTFLVEAGRDNIFAQNDIGLQVSINASLALKASLQARHNTEVQPGTERTDTLSSITIVWSPAPKAD
ncbi:DUF481 domain-containing protein [Arenimonas fontis]|nr:DUF481 domain-containing protein [Arenimonas fontis]